MTTESPMIGYRPQVTDRKGKWTGCGGGMAIEADAAAWAHRNCLPGGRWRTLEVTTREIRSGSHEEEPKL
jgi:hypothetical protein